MHPSLPTSSLPEIEPASEFCKAVVLKVSNHLFALPTTAILKIVSSSPINPSQESLTLWEGYPLILLDLHQLLGAASFDRPTNLESQFAGGNDLKNYIVIAHTSTRDRCAIAVNELPKFQDIPLSKVQTLSPYHYRLIGSIAKHRVTLPYQGVPSTIFLLNLQHALYRWQMKLSDLDTQLRSRTGGVA